MYLQLYTYVCVYTHLPSFFIPSTLAAKESKYGHTSAMIGKGSRSGQQTDVISFVLCLSTIKSYLHSSIYIYIEKEKMG